MSVSPIVRMRKHALVVAFAAISAVTFNSHAGDVPDLDGLDSSEHYQRFIVKYRDGSEPRERLDRLQAALARAARVLPQTGGRMPALVPLRRLAVGADSIKASRPLDSIEAALLMRELAADPAVEYVGIDRLHQVDMVPNDTYFSEQYGMGTGSGGIHATNAWNYSDGSGVVVAVIDTGVDAHSDLDPNLLPGYDFIADATVSNDGGGRDSNPQDDYYGCPVSPEIPIPVKPQGSPLGHGNHVAGTISAVTNNGSGVAGVAHGARVVPIRVLAQCAGFDSDVSDAIVWASGGAVPGVPANSHPAEVINLSLGGSGSCGPTLQAAVDIAVANGTTVVASAGNGNVDVSNQAPANCAGVIAVGSTDSAGAESSFSNHGSGVDLAAPGTDVKSTYIDGQEPYEALSGTSMAAPHVAGVVALVQAEATSTKSPAEVESLLKATARQFPVGSPDLGAGIVDAEFAVLATNCTLPAPVLAAPTSSSTGDYSVTWTSDACATRYELQQDGGSGWVQVYTGTATTKSFNNQPGGTYSYKVRSCLGDRCGSYSATKTTSVVYPLVAPVLTAPAHTLGDSYNITSDANQHASSYRLHERYNGGPWVWIATSTDPLDVSRTGRADGKWEYRAWICNSGGANCSDFSDPIYVVVGAPYDAPVASVANSSSGYRISWTHVAGGVSYRLHQRTNGGNWQWIHTKNYSSYKDFSGMPAGTYEYRAWTCNSDGCGPYSNVVTVTIP